MHYGYRARIGYTSPPAATEVFPYEFYLVAPPGVTLALTTLAIVELNSEEVDRSYEISIRAAKALARTRIDLMVLGGVPINLSRGFDNIEDLMRATAEEIGVPVTSSIESQVAALRQVGAKQVIVGIPFEYDASFAGILTQYGFECAGIAGADYHAVDLGTIPLEVGVRLGRELKAAHPEADTLWLPCPHWAVAKSIDPLERELGINVVTANQAICWNAFRRCGIDDRIEGYGRLFREF